MRIIHKLYLLNLLLTCTAAYAQDTLPKIMVYKAKDGLSTIQWYNDYGIVKQLTIQRSTDSLRNYASIYTMPNAMVKRNQYTDKKSKGINYYYRVYVQLPEGQYLNTPSVRAQGITTVLPITNGKINRTDVYPATDTALNGKINGTTLPKPKPFVPSEYVFTDKKNNIIISLPNAEDNNYSIVFTDVNNEQVLKINSVRESNLILEKYNFVRSGWYFFTVYKGKEIFEQHKLMISKE